VRGCITPRNEGASREALLLSENITEDKKVTLSSWVISRRPIWPPLLLDGERRLAARMMRTRESSLSPRIAIEVNEMSIINKETLEQDKRLLTVVLTYLNAILAAAFLLICFCTG
jgi:hypothetical protein